MPFADAETRPPHEIQQLSRYRQLRRRGYLKLRAHVMDAGVQLFGMCGLFHTYRRTVGWAWNLFRGNIQRRNEAPGSRLPMRSAGGGPACHALPDTPVSNGLQTIVPLHVQDDSSRSDAA